MPNRLRKLIVKAGLAMRACVSPGGVRVRKYGKTSAGRVQWRHASCGANSVRRIAAVYELQRLEGTVSRLRPTQIIYLIRSVCGFSR